MQGGLAAVPRAGSCPQGRVPRSLHVGVAPVPQGHVRLLDGLRGRPAQDVVGTPGLVIGACQGMAQRAGDTTRVAGTHRDRRDGRDMEHRRDMEGHREQGTGNTGRTRRDGKNTEGDI